MEANRAVPPSQGAEHERIAEMRGNPDGWRLWGPYLADRAWGTVREDYSRDGSAWDYFSHDQARSRAYRWNEDGIGGICDIRQKLCFAVALWNGNDPILKERLFGLTGTEGNHGEDCKEYYYYLDAVPSHAYLKFLYKYPQAAYPYTQLVEENRRRDRMAMEYELVDTGVFDDDRYFDVTVEYAKASEFDIYIRVTAVNHGAESAPLWILPHLWFRNTWSWDDSPTASKPVIRYMRTPDTGTERILAVHESLDEYFLVCETDDSGGKDSDFLFTENETNFQRLFQCPNTTPYVKDAFHEAIVDGDHAAVNPQRIGTKATAVYHKVVPAGGQVRVRMRLCSERVDRDPGLPTNFDSLFETRIAEADAFYRTFETEPLSEDVRLVQRQAFAGLIWSKQYYGYDVERWLAGDPAYPAPPRERKKRRNSEWQHVSVNDILLMPDAWEYPWFAAWDLAFHCVPMAMIDADLAKHQLLLMCREWYMHPNGQLPAYEWAFGDVNPPVHAWAALRVYQIERRWKGLSEDEPGDVDFLERIYHKLLLNFTWWVNQKDMQGNNVFEGGFLGLDNIGVFDRSAALPTGGYIEQCDGTAWMGMYCLNMLAIALELCRVDSTYQDVATKFAEHFVYIAHAINNIGEDDSAMWCDDDGFYYDVLNLPDGKQDTLRVRSMVGLTPLFAAEALTAETLNSARDFLKRIDWFLRHKPQLTEGVAHLLRTRQTVLPEERSMMRMLQDICENEDSINRRLLFSMLTEEKLRRILTRVFDEDEFLSPYGIRALSRYHEANPFVLRSGGDEYSVRYEPAESSSSLFGGNSNWRGPIWFPMNFLIIEALQRYDFVFGSSFTIEFPTGSGNYCTLGEAATEISQRLIRLFLVDKSGKRPVFGGQQKFQTDPRFQQHILFYEYFHGDNGAGLGASHQTGWTALVAKLVEQSGSGM